MAIPPGPVTFGAGLAPTIPWTAHSPNSTLGGSSEIPSKSELATSGRPETLNQEYRPLVRPGFGTDEVSEDRGQSSSQVDSRGSLAQDRIVRWIVGLMGLATVPILIPVLSEEWRATYGHHIVDFPFLAALLVAIRFRLRGVREETERRFWNLLTFGFAWWVGALVIGAASSSIDLLVDSQTIRESR